MTSIVQPIIALSLIFHTVRTQELFNFGVAEFEDSLNADDFSRGNYVFDNNQIAQEETYNDNLFEGDIANTGLNSNNVEHFLNERDQPQLDDPLGLMRNAVNSPKLLWPSRQVPYSISSQYSSYSRARIASAMDAYAKQTCIQFTPRQNGEQNYIYIMPDNGCYSMVGKNGGRQTVSIGSGCVQKGIIMHELMHAVGFFHEQSRTDRDNYVTVNYNNIRRGMAGQFSKYSNRVIQTLGAQYDYSSIMHYSSKAFSSNGQPTITPKQAGAVIGQRGGFSSTDSFKINKLYQCDGATGIVTTLPPFTQRPTFPTYYTTTPPRYTYPTAPTTNCRDTRTDCGFLNTYLGWCSSQREFMRQQCARSCNFCSGGNGNFTPAPVITNCVDKRGNCDLWAQYNLCTGTFVKFMRENCSKACGFCR